MFLKKKGYYLPISLHIIVCIVIYTGLIVKRLFVFCFPAVVFTFSIHRQHGSMCTKDLSLTTQWNIVKI